MTLDEIREIRERQSLETIGMTTAEAAAYFRKGAEKALQRIEEIRQEKSNAEKHSSKIVINQ